MADRHNAVHQSDLITHPSMSRPHAAAARTARASAGTRGHARCASGEEGNSKDARNTGSSPAAKLKIFGSNLLAGAQLDG